MKLVCDYELRENTLRVNCLGCIFGSSIEDFEACMAKTIDKLLEVKNVERIILAETRENEYDFEQVKILREIAEAYNKILNEEKILTMEKLAPSGCEKFFSKRFSDLQFLILELLRKDPIAAYVRLQKMIIAAKINEEKASVENKKCFSHYLENALLPTERILSSCKLIKIAKEKLEGYKPGDRKIYRQIFHPLVKPNFMLTRFMLLPPKGGQLLDKYYLPGNVLVEIFKVPGKVRLIYHITPPEFKLNEQKFIVLDRARNYLAAHKPTETEITEPQKAREIFFNIGKDLVRELGRSLNLDLKPEETEELAILLARYTAGFGVLELLLADDKIQDIYINSPIGLTPIYIFHSDFEECETNLIPTREDAEAWATRFRLYSGRPLDEANPVLDCELEVPGGRARVAAITRTLSPEGLAFAFRRHRERPWTLPLFLKAKMFDPLYAGLMSFIVDGGRAVLIAGGRSSGKTSLLSSLLLEIMRKFRIVVIEDTLELPISKLREFGYNIERMKARSVITRVETELAPEEALRTALRLGDSCLIVGEVRSSLKGDQEVFIVENGLTRRVPIASLEKKNKEGILVPTLDIKNDFKIKIEKLKDFVKHPKRNTFIKIKTRTGREVITTPEHSIFTVNSFVIKPFEAEKLKKGDKIIIPARIPCGYNDIDFFDLTQTLSDFRIRGAKSYIKKAWVKLGKDKVKKICEIKCVTHYIRKKNLAIPAKTFIELMKASGISYDINKLKISKHDSNCLPAKIEVNNDFCRFLGYYISEGYVGSNGLVITNSDQEVIEDIIHISKTLFRQKPRLRNTKGFGTSTQIIMQNKPLASLLLRLGCGRTCEEKRIPDFIYGLNKTKISEFLKGLYIGNGSFAFNTKKGNLIRYFTTSKKLASDLAYLLLTLGIVATIREHKGRKNRKNWYSVEFRFRQHVENFVESIFGGIELEKKRTEHSTLNLLEFSKLELEKYVKKLPSQFFRIKKLGRCTKFYLEKIVDKVECNEYFKKFVKGDFFVDEVKEVKKIKLKKSEYVYDLSINPTENFIGGFGGILLHNTESTALFEAMRIGALANVVAGTIHGESPYGVYDRVVHDLGVAPTSFKAIDLITICNMLRSPDGLHRFRRVVELTEIRKHWKQDPADEGGFVPLMQYSAKEDKLKPTETLIDGESYVLNEIAKRVREWHGRWDDVWDNILLRGKVKQTLVEYAEKLNKPEILEAEFVCDANDMFHIISEKVRQEVGALDSKMIYEKWLEWLKSRLR